MPTFYHVTVYYKDGSCKVFDGHIRDYKKLESQLGSDSNVLKWDVDWDS